MTKTEAASGAMAWIKNGMVIWPILATCATLFAGYLIAMTNMENSTAQNAKEVARLEKKVLGLEVALQKRQDRFEARVANRFSGRFVFMNDASSRVNFMCQDSPPCRARFAPLTVPE